MRLQAGRDRRSICFGLKLTVALLPALVMLPRLTGQETQPGTDTEKRTVPRVVKEARMPVRVIAGRLVVRCEISTRFRRIPVNLFVDFDRPCGLELHNRAAAGLRVDDNGGVPMTVHIPGFNIVVKRREHGDEDALNDFTRLYSDKLGETACVGTIGFKVLALYHVTFDIHAGFVFLRPPKEKTDEPPSEDQHSTVTSITLVNDFVWVPVRLANGRIMSMNLGSSRYDSILDEMLCEDMGHPAGDIGAVKLKTIDLSRYVAWRPGELVQVHADGALGTIGLNVLEHFRVEIDRVNEHVRFSETVPASFPEEDLAFFKAMVEEEPAPLVAWLEKHGKTRLAREGAELLLNLLIDAAPDAKAFEVALDWMDKTRIADLRATEALSTMKTLLEGRRPEVAVIAGEIGVRSGRKDRYPESVHKLHSKLGELLLETDKGEKAWEHLLSAAFGLPQDGVINLNLGRFYESRKRYRRAMSRYIQAVIKPESGPQAIAGLERVQQSMGGEPLSVDLVDKLIAGKVYNFGAATKFKPTKETDNNRVVLAELFTNAHFGRREREGWTSFAVGGAMGSEGLLSHFPRNRLVVLSYHVVQPEPTALMNPYSDHVVRLYGVDGPAYFIINGVRRGPGYGRWRDAEKIYDRNRELVLAALAQSSDYEIEPTASMSQGVVSGSVVFKGPEDRRLVVQVVLAERGVLYPGKANVVVHRMVARAALTDSFDGVTWKPENGRMKLDFKRALADITAANERFLAEFESNGGGNTSRLSTKIDPRQVSIVAFIRDNVTFEVLQAAQLDVKAKDKDLGNQK